MDGDVRRDTARPVLLAGACGGLGRAMAHVLAREGYRLFLVDSRADAIGELVSELTANGIDAAGFTASITDAVRLEEVAAEVERSSPSLYAVVNAAGIFHHASLQETTPAQWQKVIDVDLTGVFLVVRAFLPLLRASDFARIVNIVSTAAKNAFPNQAAYTAAKWGVLGLSHALNAELRQEGIYTTALCPGAVNTALWDTAPEFDRSMMLDAAHVAEMVGFILRQHDGVTIDELVVTPFAGAL